MNFILDRLHEHSTWHGWAFWGFICGLLGWIVAKHILENGPELVSWLVGKITGNKRDK